MFSIDEPAPTMRGVNRPVPKGYPGHPNDACPVSPDMHVLSTEERAWIQTFPKTFKWVGNKTDVEQMIGNAVPVNLAKYVAETVELAMVDTEQFKKWLKDNTQYSDAVISDMSSRIKRADNILTWYDDEVYQFYLEQDDQYKLLSTSVRSQIKKSVKLYRQFITSK